MRLLKTLPWFVLAAAAACALYAAARSPLRHIPAAHPLARVTPWWITLAMLRDRRNAAVHRAHQRHGAIVALGPREVSVASPSAVKAIYAGGWPKDPWYSVFENYGWVSAVRLPRRGPRAG